MVETARLTRVKSRSVASKEASEVKSRTDLVRELFLYKEK